MSKASIIKKAVKAAPGKNNSVKETDPSLKVFFIGELKDIYWAEKKLVSSLPKMQKAATSDVLKSAIENHLVVTKTHVSRLEQVFELLGEKPQAKKCEAMEGILTEGEGIIEETNDGSATRDVGIILASQKVEHYEIASYGGLKQLAVTLGHDDIAGILAQTLEEEKEADSTLSSIAENGINYEASDEGEENEA